MRERTLQSKGPSEDTDIAAEIRALGPWFHNLHLPGGHQTAPDHALGDFPNRLWEVIAPELEQDLGGISVLDIGCNAGFYSFELARRGAEVVAIDPDPHYLRQARWAADQMGVEDQVHFEEAGVYDLYASGSRYDIVLFMGVLYHLRHPLLALDIVARRVGGLAVIQSLVIPQERALDTPADLDFTETARLAEREWPGMAFIEHRLAGDPTNWWVPDRACLEGMLATSGLRVKRRLTYDIRICVPSGRTDWLEDQVEEELAAVFRGGRSSI